MQAKKAEAEPAPRGLYFSRMSQIFLFTGEGSFLLREERNAWQQAFVAKHGADNLLRLDGHAISYRQLLDEVSVMPFLADKRLVMVEGIPRFEKEEVEALPAHVHQACVLVFLDPKPDKRLGGVKSLLALATVKEFRPVTGAALRQWAKEYAGRQGASIDDAAVTALLETVGDDQDMLAREIEKLCTHAGAAITKAHVESLAVPSGEQEVWQLSNLIARGDAPGAIRYARRLLGQGEDPHSVWNILLWMVRMLVMVHAAVQDGERNPAKIAGKAEVPFPSARTLLPLAEKASTKNVSSLVSWASHTDQLLKTGGYRATGEAPQELLALIDECVLRCTALKA